MGRRGKQREKQEKGQQGRGERWESKQPREIRKEEKENEEEKGKEICVTTMSDKVNIGVPEVGGEGSRGTWHFYAIISFYFSLKIKGMLC